MFPPSCNGKRVEDLQKEQSIQKTYYLKNVVLLGQNKIGTDKSSDRDKIVYSYKKKIMPGDHLGQVFLILN